VFQNAILLIYSSSPRIVRPDYATSGWRVGDLYIDQGRTYAFLVAVIASLALWVFLQRTLTGRAIRASSQDWEAATYMGINVERTHSLAFGIGIGLTAIGGVMLSTFQPIGPFVGLEYVVVMFVAVVLGGLGSVTGALAGGLAIGLVQSVSQVWTSSQLANVWVFLLFLIVLYVRPQGLFGRAARGV
jgi:branched-chain amino acid transport system permease protein